MAEQTVTVITRIPVLGYRRGQEVDLPREQAIDLAQSGWVTILEKPEKRDAEVSELRYVGEGDGGEPDHAGVDDGGLDDASDADDSDGGESAGGSGVGEG